MTAITKERIKLFIKNPLDNGLTRGEQMELARIALASIEAEPVAWKWRLTSLFDGVQIGPWRVCLAPLSPGKGDGCKTEAIPLYTAPPVPVVPAALPENDDEDGHDIDYLEPSEVYALGRTAGWNACRAAILQGSQPVSQTYKFPVNTPCQDAPAHIWLQTAGVWPEDGELSELTWCSHNQHHDDTLYVRADLVNGNSPVTPDGLSTVCAEAYQVVGVMADALGVFGDAAVQKVLDNLSQQKLVHRDVLPFSRPVTPDGWISCSERMPEKNQNVLISVNFDSDLVEPLICSARYTGSTFRRGGVTVMPGNGIEQATHWMPLPEPPQGVNRG